MVQRQHGARENERQEDVARCQTVILDDDWYLRGGRQRIRKHELNDTERKQDNNPNTHPLSRLRRKIERQDGQSQHDQTGHETVDQVIKRAPADVNLVDQVHVRVGATAKFDDVPDSGHAQQEPFAVWNERCRIAVGRVVQIDFEHVVCPGTELEGADLKQQERGNNLLIRVREVYFFLYTPVLDTSVITSIGSFWFVRLWEILPL